MTESCENCRFWKSVYINSNAEGTCHRFPPVADRKPENDPFPLTVGCDWCGEYQPAEPKGKE